MLWLISIPILLPFVLYVFQSEKWRMIWYKTPNEVQTGKDICPLISVIIPFRNEKANLPYLVQSLAQQTYANWELILVDDHSNDNGLANLQKALKTFPVNLQIINNQGIGKKQALLSGVKMANGELIVSSDCDCTFENTWLQSIASFYAQHSPDLIIGPVKLLHTESIFSDFQVNEFIALQISGGAAAIDQKAIMLNGANLACRKNIYLKSNLQNHIASGDDMFLLEFLKQHRKSIGYLKSTDAMVYTKAEPSLSCLLTQKARWAAKAKHYRDKEIIRTGMIVFTTNLTQLILLILAFYKPLFINLYIATFVARLTVDFRLINTGKDFFTYMACLRKMIFYQLFYPLYVVVVAVYPLFRPIDWKGRLIKN